AMGALFLLVIILTKPIEKITEAMQNHIGEANSVMKDTVSGIQIIRSFNANKIFSMKFNKAIDMSLKKALKLGKIGAIVTPLAMFLEVVPFVFSIIYGGYLVIQGEITTGSVIAFVFLLENMIQPSTMIAALFSDVRSACGTFRRIFEIMDMPEERSDGECFDSKESTYAIEFSNVTFAYESDKEKKVLDGISFQIPEGSMTAIVGLSGSGKSTVFKLLNGFYEEYEGNIRLFGHDLKNWSLNGARSNLSYLSQESYLFPDTIGMNISCVNDAPEENVLHAAQIAHIDEFVSDLENGYDTVIGEGGAKLSGGQKQRISLARCVYKNAPILLLDEPTSSLDVQNEAVIQSAISDHMKGRTIVVIAHRLSTIKKADLVLVLDEGKIIEKGTHDQLMQNSGLYKRIYEKQISAGKEQDEYIAQL
ncbi:MAG TPA: ABC transporter ATP-binding protein, partial [Clostridia bacterium]